MTPIKEIKDTLPNTLHELTRVAADDFLELFCTKGYQIYMNSYVERDRKLISEEGMYWAEKGENCLVCLAGSVMIKESLPEETDILRYDYPKIWAKIDSIDDVRQLMFERAYERVYNKEVNNDLNDKLIELKLSCHEVTTEEANTAPFETYTYLLELADKLEIIGI